MSRGRLLAILVAVVVVGVGVYFLAFKPVVSEGVVDHKTMTGTRDQTSYGIVVFTTTGSQFDDNEVQSLFDETGLVSDEIEGQLDIRYDEIFYVVSVRSEGDTVGYFVSREDFNEVVPGSRIRFSVQSRDEWKIKIKKVLD